MDPSTFEYLSPTESQMEDMHELRGAFSDLARALQSLVPDGSDKDLSIQYLRTAAMWANVAITRRPDGSPRR